MKKISVLICFLIAGLSLVLTANNAQAGSITGVMTEFNGNGWSQFQMNNNPTDAGNPFGLEDYVGVDSEPGGEDKVGPGYGGQAFDAEYLFYKRIGNTLSLGLQTGFNLSDSAAGSDGPVKVGGINYYAGDLALRFGSLAAGDPGDFEYAVDFGLYTEDYADGFAHGDPVGGANNARAATPGRDDEGLYRVTTWNNDVINTPAPGFQASDPFAMETGTRLGNLTANDLLTPETQNGETSYARIVSFDLSLVGIAADQELKLLAHWTMSCGNDEINGYVSEPGSIGGGPSPVPEPATIALFGIGLAGLAGGAATRRFKKRTQL